MTAGRPIEAVMQGLREVGDELGNTVRIIGVGTTGSGRYMIADYVGADIVKNEITAQATAAAFIDKNVDTIFEIGGQDSKYISLRDGVIVDFEMNKACAAGTGSFLEEQAEKLNIAIKDEFASSALSAKNPCRLGERCTVFMENSLMSKLQKGADRNDLLAGLAYSIVQNYINRVVAGKHIGKNIFFQGGVAFNKSVVAAFEKYLDTKITVPPHHDVTGAIGMALIARDYMAKNNRASKFKGFELSKRKYEISSFECKGCSNVCEINRVKIEAEKDSLFYGGRCEKYDVRKNKTASTIQNLFAFREEMLWKSHNEYKNKSVGNKTKIGIPYIFYFQDYLPFWTTLLWELGFDVETSSKTNRQTVNLGLESNLAETCFPIKVAYGHLKQLLNSDVDAVLMPSFINLGTDEKALGRGLACPLTQTVPYVSRVALDVMNLKKVRILSPVINVKLGKKFLINELSKKFRHFAVKKNKIEHALEKAESAQKEFRSAVQSKGAEILSSLNNNLALVIVGRAYNSFDNGMNLEIPKKLADLGILSIPMDFLPLKEQKISKEWPNLYWRAGQRIIKAARMIKGNDNLYPIYIGSFLCGPDSFILKYFKKELHGKPFLHIEIDEHSADAGIITRCEAFLDSIQNKQDARCRIPDLSADMDAEYQHSPKRKSQASAKADKSGIAHPGLRTVYIPMMSDHAFALAAAFEHCGVPAEVMPEPDKTTIDIGKKYVSGKECYPCAVTTGDMLKKVFSKDFDPDKSAFFMPSGSGPCRFGQYNVFHRLVLDQTGCENVPIFSPAQDSQFYNELGIVGKDFAIKSWEGIIAIELLTKCLHETRPYEKEKGSADAIYKNYLGETYLSLIGKNGKINRVLESAKKDFENLPKYKTEKPLIGIIGEIFVRSNKFSNENLVRKIEALGGKAWLSPVEEWVYYINFIANRKALLKKEWSAIMNTFVTGVFQKRIEHKYTKFFKGFLETLNEPETKEILRKAAPYLHDSYEGEAILSIGKMIDLIEKGASGIVNAMPFGCMPGTIVTALMHGVKRKYGIPCISIPYDGTESPTTEIQLEAFMHQAKEYKNDVKFKVQKFIN
jgi:predicted CoA-substrate-specific enzyme activase